MQSAGLRLTVDLVLSDLSEREQAHRRSGRRCPKHVSVTRRMEPLMCESESRQFRLMPLKTSRKCARKTGWRRKVCSNGAKNVIGKIWSQLLEHVEARSVFIKSIMWRSTDFLRHVVEAMEGRGAVTFTFVCEHCNLIPAEDFLWWVFTVHGWWCRAGGQPYEWSKPDRQFTLQIGDTANQQVVFPAYRAPAEECHDMIIALKTGHKSV